VSISTQTERYIHINAGRSESQHYNSVMQHPRSSKIAIGTAAGWRLKT
jgi:hypothetical protein